jgi:hypothetical protein
VHCLPPPGRRKGKAGDRDLIDLADDPSHTFRLFTDDDDGPDAA